MNRFLVLAIFFIQSFSLAGSLDVANAKNSVEFLAIGQPSALKIKGAATAGEKNFSGQLKTTGNKVSGTIVLQLSSLDSGIALRDDHMKNKYLEIGTYPTAELTLNNVEVKSDESPFTGQLKLHGVTKPIEGKISGTVDKAKLEMKLDFPVLIKDHGISIPSYLGIKVANDVTVNASTEGKLL